MKKHLFLILSILLTGVFTPTFSLADQTPIISDIADAGVETVLPKIEETAKASTPAVTQSTSKHPAPVVAQKTAQVEKPAPAQQSTPVQAPAPIAAPNTSKPADSISIAGKNLNITTVDSTAADSGNHVNRFKKGNFDGRFLYGHNSVTVFGGLKNLGVGNTFSVTLDGVENTYRIAKIVIFNKNVAKGTIELPGDSTNYMTPVAKATFKGEKFDLSIMTCHGKSLGGGDATERLVIFANRI